MVVAWSNRIHSGGNLRSQFTHCIDVAPTILELIGIPEPTAGTHGDKLALHRQATAQFVGYGAAGGPSPSDVTSGALKFSTGRPSSSPVRCRVS